MMTVIQQLVVVSFVLLVLSDSPVVVNSFVIRPTTTSSTLQSTTSTIIRQQQQQQQQYAVTNDDNNEQEQSNLYTNNNKIQRIRRLTSSSVLSTTTKTNNNNGRRESFGAMLGSVLLPTTVAAATAATTTTAPQVVQAATGDDYPFKNTVKKLAEAFPEAVPNNDLIKKVTKRLSKYGYDDSVLVAFSLCADEVNRPLEDTFYGWYGEHFNMGGLAGFPFAGVTGFGAMAAHIPDGGSCLLVYGPHVGIDKDGNVGKINRKGKGKSGSCCGSAVAASKYITAVYEGKAETVGPPADSVDAQQNYVSAALLPFGEAVAKAKDPMIELPFATYEPIDKMMLKIISKAGKGVKEGKIAMLGGLQINTPRGMSDYFLPLRFDIRNSSGEVLEDLLWTRKPGSEVRGASSIV